MNWVFIPGDGILHSHRRENLKLYTAVTGWTLERRGKVSPVKYELARRENLKSYIA
jgi:hypothetical protein